MKSKIILSFIGIFVLFHSCISVFREVTCRDFEFEEELKWYSGVVGDAVTFINNENETKTFVIVDKYLHHQTKYISDTGCSCYDLWGITLAVGNDTIMMYGRSKYLEKNLADKYILFFIKYKEQGTAFWNEYQSIVSNYTVENSTFTQVMIFEYLYDYKNMFTKVVIAPEIGVVELMEADGTVWINADLKTKLNIGISSFAYIEDSCEMLPE